MVDTIYSEPAAVYAVDRAIGDLRRGGAVLLGGASASVVLSPEFVSERELEELRALSDTPPRLILTAQRARALGHDPDRAPVVALPIGLALGADILREIADPAATGAPMGIDLATHATHAAPGDTAAIELAKLANLLPAMIATTLPDLTDEARAAWASGRDLLTVTPDQIETYEHVGSTSLRRVSAARVPLAGAEDTHIIAFRPASGGVEHLAIVIGDPNASEAPLIRLHSQCFTGDLLGSLRCDCGDQLRGAVTAMAKDGAGAILYLAQEGRGIGLVNKLRAYQLQDQGLDTVEANQQLGFDADERHYRVAAEMLRQLGLTRIRLLTNNPDKVKGLTTSGIEVTERVGHSFPSNEHNRFYLDTKARRSGHILP